MNNKQSANQKSSTGPDKFPKVFDSDIDEELDNLILQTFLNDDKNQQSAKKANSNKTDQKVAQNIDQQSKLIGSSQYNSCKLVPQNDSNQSHSFQQQQQLQQTSQSNANQQNLVESEGQNSRLLHPEIYNTQLLRVNNGNIQNKNQHQQTHSSVQHQQVFDENSNLPFYHNSIQKRKLNNDLQQNNQINSVIQVQNHNQQPSQSRDQIELQQQKKSSVHQKQSKVVSGFQFKSTERKNKTGVQRVFINEPDEEEKQQNYVPGLYSNYQQLYQTQKPGFSAIANNAVQSDLSNHNLIDNKKSRVNKALKLLREMKTKPRYKDKYGNNVKQHFGIYKYFINTQTQEKEKFYISHECQKIPASQAMKTQQKEMDILAQHKYHYYESIQKTGRVVKDKNRLEYWGLPSGICDQFYKHTKIQKLFDWQSECLSQSKEVLDGKKNLIYFAPTSGGKSVVAELLMLRQILGYKKRAVYVLPFVSIVTEKQQYLTKLLENVNVKIIGLHSQSENVWSPGVDIAICTIEKANSLLNRIIEERAYFDVGFFIIDEFHLILDEGRGYQLESLIAKLRTVETIMNREKSFQIVGMSATLSGLDYLKQWFGGNCELYECQFRPVPLSEYLQIGSKLFNKEMKMIMDLSHLPKFQMIDSNGRSQTLAADNDYLPLVLSSYLRKKKAVLIFCPSKVQCEQVAKKLAAIMPTQYPEYESKQSLHYEDIETEIKEIGYRTGALLVLAATSTLSTGINLPAKAVFFKGPYIAQMPMDAAKYKQMSGRAGRTGFDSKGDSIMMCTNNDREYVLDLMKPFYCELKSALTGQRLMRSLLEIIASNVVTSFKHIRIFIQSTLKYTLCQKMRCNSCTQTYFQNEILFGVIQISDEAQLQKVQNQYNLYLETFRLEQFKDEIQDDDCKNCMLEFSKQVVAYLSKFKFLTFNPAEGTILPTQLGKAAFASSIPPEHGQKIFEDLAQARGNLVLETDLHLLYLITPHFKQIREPNWDAFIRKFSKLSKGEKNVAEFYGLDMEYLYKATVYPPKLPVCLQDPSNSNGSSSMAQSKGLNALSLKSKMEKQATLTQSTMNTSSVHSKDSSALDISSIQTPSMTQMDQLIQLQQLTAEEQKLVRYCKFYMAMIMNEILKETPQNEICNIFNIKRGDIQTIQALAVNYSGMLSAFCERLFWSDYSVLLMRINEKINWCVKEELLDLMQCSSLRPERARALFTAGYETIEDIAKNGEIESMVKIFDKNDGFMSHRKSNEGDLKMRYDYYYTLAHKVFCEAKMIMVKRKVDPDRTMMSYMQEQQQFVDVDQRYVLDSDYSSSEGSVLEGDDEQEIEELAKLLEENGEDLADLDSDSDDNTNKQQEKDVINNNNSKKKKSIQMNKIDSDSDDIDLDDFADDSDDDNNEQDIRLRGLQANQSNRNQHDMINDVHIQNTVNQQLQLSQQSNNDIYDEDSSSFDLIITHSSDTSPNKKEQQPKNHSQNPNTNDIHSKNNNSKNDIDLLLNQSISISSDNSASVNHQQVSINAQAQQNNNSLKQIFDYNCNSSNNNSNDRNSNNNSKLVSINSISDKNNNPPQLQIQSKIQVKSDPAVVRYSDVSSGNLHLSDIDLFSALPDLDADNNIKQQDTGNIQHAENELDDDDLDDYELDQLCRDDEDDSGCDDVIQGKSSRKGSKKKQSSGDQFHDEEDDDDQLLDEMCQLLEDNRDDPKHVETLTSTIIESPHHSKGQLFIINQQSLNNKIEKNFTILDKSTDEKTLNYNELKRQDFIENQVKSVKFEFEVMINYELRENQKHRLIAFKFQQNSEGINSENFFIEIGLMTQNRLLVKYKTFDGYKKACLSLTNWNKFTITFKDDGQCMISINEKLMLNFNVLSEDTKNVEDSTINSVLRLNLQEVLKSLIIMGGHFTHIQADKQKNQHLFDGFIQDFNLILCDNQLNGDLISEIYSKQNESKEYKHMPRFLSDSEEEKYSIQQQLKIQSQEKNCENDILSYNNDQFVFIHSLYELAKFDANKHMYHKSSQKLVERPSRERKVLICHDIPKGSLEEKYSQGLYSTKNNHTSEIQKSWYRFNHWSHIDIFVFFGHYTVTIPPPAYIDIAHQHGVKMLGTLIFEWDEGGKEAQIMLDGKVAPFSHSYSNDESTGNTQRLKFVKDAPDGNRFYIKKLVEIAQHFGFDGYLMNFECEIKEPQVLMQWLEELTLEMHRVIPGSQIIWYDSVLHDGSLQWQSMLNELNYKFLQVTDGFFTDYKWKADYLEKCLSNFNQFVKNDSSSKLTSYDIYIGNDTFGRGTFGGGRHNIYQAFNEIVKYPFSIALFGQAYWYENHDGFQDSSIFNLNEEIFWRGKEMKLIADSTGKKYKISQDDSGIICDEKICKDWNMEIADNKWKIVQDKVSLQYTSIACFEDCMKYVVIDIQDLIYAQVISSVNDLKGLVFLAQVKGTLPNCKDPYKIQLFLLANDEQKTVIYESKTYEADQYDYCDEKGLDVEYWAGHYGAEFSQERVFIELKPKHQNLMSLDTGEKVEKSLQKIIQTRGFAFEDVCTYFNNGLGSQYFVDGKLDFTGNYSNYHEYDLSLISNSTNEHYSKLNSYFTANIVNHGPCFMGASCLQIQGSLQSKDDEIYIPLQEIQLLNNHEFYDMKIAFKLHYPDFKDGYIALVFTYEDNKTQQVWENQDEIEIFNKQIKQQGLIYTQNSWAIYEERMMQLLYNNNFTLKSIGLRVAKTNLKHLDLRIGMIAIVPSLQIPPDQIKMTLKSGLPQTYQHPVSIATNQTFLNVHLGWDMNPIGIERNIKNYRIYRNDEFIGTTKIDRYFDQRVQKCASQQITYKIQAISKRNEIIAELIIDSI